MGRLTHREENGKAAVWIYADPEKPAEVCREQLRKEQAVINKLAHYEDLEEAGRLVILPEEFDKEKFIYSNCPSYLTLKDHCNGDCKACWEAALKGEKE